MNITIPANRAQRRAVLKQIRSDKNRKAIASICPVCGKLSNFYTVKSYKDDSCFVKCLVCDNVIKKGVTDVDPGMYVKIEKEKKS